MTWDTALLTLNIVMAGLKKMALQTFIFNVVVLFVIDGYLNLIILSLLK